MVEWYKRCEIIKVEINNTFIIWCYLKRYNYGVIKFGWYIYRWLRWWIFWLFELDVKANLSRMDKLVVSENCEDKLPFTQYDRFVFNYDFYTILLDKDNSIW